MKTKKPSAASTRFSISGVPADLLKTIGQIARREGRSRSAQIRFFLASAVRQRESAQDD